MDPAAIRDPELRGKGAPRDRAAPQDRVASPRPAATRELAPAREQLALRERSAPRERLAPRERTERAAPLVRVARAQRDQGVGVTRTAAWDPAARVLRRTSPWISRPRAPCAETSSTRVASPSWVRRTCSFPTNARRRRST